MVVDELYFNGNFVFSGTTVMIINPGLGDKKMVSDTDAMLLSYQNEAGSSSG